MATTSAMFGNVVAVFSTGGGDHEGSIGVTVDSSFGVSACVSGFGFSGSTKRQLARLSKRPTSNMVAAIFFIVSFQFELK